VFRNVDAPAASIARATQSLHEKLEDLT